MISKNLNLFIIFYLLFPMIGKSDNFVLAYRPGIAVTKTPWPQLHYETYNQLSTWLTGQLNGSAMTDFSRTRTDVAISSACLDFNGAGDKLTFSKIPAGATVTNGGTATLSISTNTVNATAGSAWDIKIYDGVTLWAHLPAQEGAGSKAYDVHSTNHADVANVSGTVWDGTQTNSPYYAEYGGVEWTNATTTVYVPHRSDKVTPASTNVASCVIAQTNTAGLAHNAGPYSLILGGSPYTYTEILTYGFSISTNAAGLIESLYQFMY